VKHSSYLLGVDVVAGVDAVDADTDNEAVLGAAAVAEIEAVTAARPTARSAKLDGRVLRSEIEGVTDSQWTDFVLALATATLGSVSASNAMGMFELKPRRMADVGLLKNVRCTESPTGRLVWVGDFVAPMTSKKFLSDADAQYRALGDSMRDYMSRMYDGEIDCDVEALPEGMSLSGALAILHRCGPTGLRKWLDEDRFSDTVALYERCNGIF